MPIREAIRREEKARGMGGEPQECRQSPPRPGQRTTPPSRRERPGGPWGVPGASFHLGLCSDVWSAPGQQDPGGRDPFREQLVGGSLAQWLRAPGAQPGRPDLHGSGSGASGWGAAPLREGAQECRAVPAGFPPPSGEQRGLEAGPLLAGSAPGTAPRLPVKLREPLAAVGHVLKEELLTSPGPWKHCWAASHQSKPRDRRAQPRKPARTVFPGPH